MYEASKGFSIFVNIYIQNFEVKDLNDTQNRFIVTNFN
jgi:hypothetical protein